MTTRHSTIAKFTKPLSGIYSSITRKISQYLEAKAQGVRLAYLVKSLSALDRHILKDIGMEGFDRLSPAQKEHALLNWSNRTS